LEIIKPLHSLFNGDSIFQEEESKEQVS
jgi:hypothetical protein